MHFVDEDLIRSLDGRRLCLAIGVFDGVHLGHQQVFRRTIDQAVKSSALSVAVTFDRHPSAIVAPSKTPKLIYSLRKRLRVIQESGVDQSLVISFDESFSRLSGEEFVHALVRNVGTVQSICVGTSFEFGHKRSGNLRTLESIGATMGFTVFGVPPVSIEQIPVSSTRIREAIGIGDFSSAEQMLGRRYSLAAKVVRGDGLGRQMGFPTANLDVRGLVLPPNGVYAARAEIRNETHPAVINIGCRPTLREAKAEVRVEAHLIDFEREIYGEAVELTLVNRLGGEETFQDVTALKGQIARDRDSARSLLN